MVPGSLGLIEGHAQASPRGPGALVRPFPHRPRRVQRGSYLVVISFLTSSLTETSSVAPRVLVTESEATLSRSCTDIYYACMYLDREIYLQTESTRLHHSPHAEYLLLSITPLLAKVERDISVLDHMSVLSATSRRYGWNSLLDLPAHCQTEQCQEVDQ